MWCEIEITRVEVVSALGMGNHGSQEILHNSIEETKRTTVQLVKPAQSPKGPSRHNSDPGAHDLDQEPCCSSHHPVQRSYSVPVRERHTSIGSYSSSLEGGYTDIYDGMTPITFGGSYHKDVPRKYHQQSFDEAHGHKLVMPLDSKHGSGFDLDWQYDDKKRRHVLSHRCLKPDHPLYHKLAPRIMEVAEEQSGQVTRKSHK